MSEFPTPTDAHASPLSRTGKYLIIATAFLGWFFGGTHMAINGLVMRTAALNLLVVAGEGELTDSDRATIATMEVGQSSRAGPKCATVWTTTATT